MFVFIVMIKVTLMAATWVSEQLRQKQIAVNGSVIINTYSSGSQGGTAGIFLEKQTVLEEHQMMLYTIVVL